jgi:hypothetical protein
MQTAISPVQVYPATANTLYIRSIGLGPPPSYYYELQEVTVVAGTPAVGVEGEEGYVPATPDTTTVVVLKNGNVSMTQEQWDGWSETVNDDEYQLDSISANLGLTRA